MPLLVTRPQLDSLLSLDDPESGLYSMNHIFEPEFHQEIYVSVVRRLSQRSDTFQIGNISELADDIHRGSQPRYADTVNDPTSKRWEGMYLDDGSQLLEEDEYGFTNVCAMKSICVRFGYIDLGTARSVSRDFYSNKKNRAGVKKNDVLINSTGDGTIGRVAVFNYDFPAIVDGHITIIRLDNPSLAWYLAAFLLSDDGQKQIYRYINGSSGQVEIYPQDIARIWVRKPDQDFINLIANDYRDACIKHDQFRKDLKTALNKAEYYKE